MTNATDPRPTVSAFRDQIAATAMKESIDAIAARLRELETITGPTETFYRPPNAPGSFSPDWSRPHPNWAFQYAESEDEEKRQEARLYLESLTGQDWRTAADLCRERDVLHDVLSRTPGPLDRYVKPLLASIPDPTPGETQAAAYFRSLVRQHLVSAYEIPAAADLQAFMDATRQRFAFLSPNRVALR